MKHPDDGVLLAYVRRQPYPVWPGGLQRHIEGCETCRARCAEYAHVGTILEHWTHAPAYSFYPSITEAVLRKVREPERSTWQRLQGGPSFGSLRLANRSLRLASLATGLVLAFLFTAVFVALAGGFRNFTGSLPGMNVAEKPIVLTIPRQPTSKPIGGNSANITPGPDVPSSGGATVNTPDTSGNAVRPTLNNCTIEKDQDQSKLHICGYGFIPGHKVSLVLMSTGGKVKKLKPLLVANDGTLQAFITVYDCEHVPAEIDTEDNGVPVNSLQPLKHITYRDCPVT